MARTPTPKLKSNLVARVDRFPKPRSAAMALQPLFEAISNAIHSTQDRYKKNVKKLGEVEIEILNAGSSKKFKAKIEDNGFGLDKKNFEAFLTTDTDNKALIGGKGVGRLLWLDAFEKIIVESWSKRAKGDPLLYRNFRFNLSNESQIEEYSEEDDDGEQTGVRLNFTGLRENGYATRFPKRETVFI